MSRLGPREGQDPWLLEGGVLEEDEMQGFELGHRLQLKLLEMYFSHSRKNYSETLGGASRSSS